MSITSSQHVSSYCPYYHGDVSFVGIVHVQASLQGGIVLAVVHLVFMLAPENTCPTGGSMKSKHT